MLTKQFENSIKLATQALVTLKEKVAGGYPNQLQYKQPTERVPVLLDNHNA